MNNFKGKSRVPRFEDVISEDEMGGGGARASSNNGSAHRPGFVRTSSDHSFSSAEGKRTGSTMLEKQFQKPPVHQ